MAAKDKSKDGASAGRKPWRYYYVMALPLGGSSGITQDKARLDGYICICDLQEITEMTAAIEQREEEYLHKVAARNAAHAAAVEAERKAAEGKQKTPMASHVAWALRRLHVVSATLLLVAVGVLYLWYMHDDVRDHVPPSLVRAAVTGVGILLAVNVAGWVAAWKCSVNGARLLLFVGVALIVGLTLGLDELNIIRRSQGKLIEALASSEDALTQDTIALILNGGTTPSLAQRFVFDAPSAFISWLGEHCTDSPATKLSYESVVIDQREFFSPLWNDNAKSCATAALWTCIRINEIAEPIIIGEVGLLGLQVLFTGLFLAVSGSSATGKTAKRRRQPSLMKPSSSYSQASSTALSTALFTRLLVLSTALFGSSTAIASSNLLSFCSIADFHAIFTWMVIVSLLSGISALVAALFVGCGWKKPLAGVLLVLAVASEVFMLAEFINIAARLIGPDLTAEIDQTRVQELRDVYVKASGQTCSSIKRWISHVCVRTSSSNSPAEFDSSCQHEFVALLAVSFNFTDRYLAWSIGVKLVLLVQLILPALRQAVTNALHYVCCISSSRDEISTGATELSLQQSLPPVDYDKALDVYLATLRVRDPDRLTAEREAFEREWTIRTGRTLADVRTPRVLVAASDFGAIVRTLMLRRLTAICKFDLSMSMSSDGKLVLVHIFASDNLLLATLCEMETYRLQFADAIDPGRSFWRDKKEVNADQKVLDANTVKHKLKLLLADTAMHPKEATWFSGESLTRVSARIQALSRLSRASKGVIRCRNRAPAFASYSPSIQRQFIYKKYPNRLEIPDTYRRSVVLRTVDCIRITRHIIEAEFDTNAAISGGLVASLHCLHSPSRFDFNSRAALASAWVTFWRPAHLPGEFWPDERPVLNLLGRAAPFRQPLQAVRDYFAEKIAFYFAWIAFYGKMAVIPALAAAIVMVFPAGHSSVSALWIFFTSPHQSHADNGVVSEGLDKMGATLSLSELVLGVLVIVWGFGFAKLWERRSVWYQLQWGVTTSDTVSSVGPLRFDADHTVVQKSSLCSEIASLQRQLESWICVLVLGIANLLVVLSMLLSQGVLVDVCGEKLAILASCACQAFLVQWNGACIPSVAHALTRWECPRYSTDHPAYRSSVVAKLFTLQLFNTFTGLMLLLLSSVGGLEMLAQFVVPLRPLYVSYNAQIEGHVGVFIQMETLILALFAAQMCTRIVLILSAVKRFNEIQRGEQSYGRANREEETMLSTYPGPDKDYAQIVMQVGLVVMFSGACPLLPLLALVDCGVKLRQNALELCCIRQRPEPEGVQSDQDNDDDIGLGLWGPYVLLMLKISVPIALAIVALTADNFDDVSIERRVGWWLVGVLGLWLVAQLLWFLIPRESRQAEEARARNAFLVERYFGHAEVTEQKASAKDEPRIEKEAASLQEPPPSALQSLHHYEERLELLHRLNVALRKREEIRVPFISTEASVVPATAGSNLEQMAQEEATEESYPTEVQDAEADLAPTADEDAMQRVSESSEEMIVGYFRPVRGAWPPPPDQPAEEVEEVKEEIPVDIVESVDVEAPTLQPPRRGSVFPGSLPLSELKISDSGDEEMNVTGSQVERGGDSVRPAPLRLSKLFKRVPASAPAVEPSSAFDDAEMPLTSPFVPAEASYSPPDLDPGMLVPTQLSAEGEVPSPEGSRSDELLEEKLEPPVSSAEEATVSIAPPAVGLDPPVRPFSPRLSFLRRKSKPPPSTHSDNDSDRGSEAETGARASEQTLLRQLSPRLSFLRRKSKRSSSKVSEGEESKSGAGEEVPEPASSAPRKLSKSSSSKASEGEERKSSGAGLSVSVVEPSPPRKLSKLFKRVQPPPAASPPAVAETPAPPSAPLPSVDSLPASAFERAEVEGRPVLNRKPSIRDQFDFLSDAHSESTSTQRPSSIQRRRSSGISARPPSPPPVYTKVDLSGLEAVREAASRRQFDFSADD